MLSRRTLATIGTVVAFVVVLGPVLWARSGGDGTTQTALDPAVAATTADHYESFERIRR